MVVFCVDMHVYVMKLEHARVCRRAYTYILCVYFHSYGLLLVRTDVGKPTKIRAEATL